MIRRAIALAATAVVAAVGLFAGAASSHPTSPAFPPERPTRVLVLGDSVPAGAISQFKAALPGREVVVDAAVNRSTNQGADLIADPLGTDWDVVIVMLGHNDGGSPTAFQPAARRILDQLRDVPRVSWLSIHEVRDYYPGVNDYIEGLTEEYPNLHVADWNSVAAANPDGIAGDGLHLGPKGATLMAALAAEEVAAAERAHLEALNPTTTTSTTTTTAATTTTTEDEPIEVIDEVGMEDIDDGVPVEPIAEPAPEASDGSDSTAVILLAVAGVLLVIATGATIVIRRRRISDQETADLAG